MPRDAVDLPTLLRWVDDPRAREHLRSWFEPDRARTTVPRHPGSRFESFAGGGDRPEAADRITVDDVGAVSLLGVHVPGDVSLDLIEGDLGSDVGWCLQQIPSDAGIDDPAAAELLGTGSPASLARDLLEEPHGMSYAVADTLLARKRPRLIPVHDEVVRCADGFADDPWGWLLTMFAGGALSDHLVAARERAGVPAAVPALRVLHVVVEMRHRPGHYANGCPGAG